MFVNEWPLPVIADSGDSSEVVPGTELPVRIEAHTECIKLFMPPDADGDRAMIFIERRPEGYDLEVFKADDGRSIVELRHRNKALWVREGYISRVVVCLDPASGRLRDPDWLEEDAE